jgi:hypothetical protein
MADALKPLTGTVEAPAVAGLEGISVEGTTEPSMAGEDFPRELFGGLIGGGSNENPTPMATGVIMDPLTAANGDVLPLEAILDVPNNSPNKATPASDLTDTPASPLSPDGLTSPRTRQIPNFERMEPRFNDGYDSDGMEPPPNGNDEFEEDAIMERQSDGVEILLEGEEMEAEMGENPPLQQPRHIAISEDALKKLTVAELKHELRIREVQFGSTLKKTGLL